MILHRAVLLGGLTTLVFACGSDPAPAPEAPVPQFAPQARPGFATEVYRCGPQDSQKSAVVSIDRSCTNDADCTFATEPVCCGPQRAIGVKKADRNKLVGCASCPSTACQIGPLVAEDGKYSNDYPNGSDVLVTCVASVCRSQIRKSSP